MTFMFCDLVGSTRLSQELDPEDLRDILGDYRNAAASAVRRFEGTIAQYAGDGILVYFGYPVAHEDDARRAVQAALDIVRSVRELSDRLRVERGQPISVRIGIHTDFVVVGDLGGANRTEPLARGDTPTIAARIQGLAEPDTVVISAATQRLAAGFFRVASLGLQQLKGVSEPLEAFKVLAASGAHHRVEAAQAAQLTPYVGREKVLTPLTVAWQEACEGAGRVALVVGEAGVGKTRLIHVFREAIASRARHQLECFCSPYYKSTAFYPMGEMLRVRLRLADEEKPERQIERLRGALDGHGRNPEESLALVAQLLGIPPEAGYRPSALHPVTQRQRTLEILLELILGPAQSQPSLLVIEDVHWIDPSTLELLGALIQRIGPHRLLVLMTARPSFRAPWPESDTLALLQVSDLSPAETEMMIQRISGDKPLPPEVLSLLVRKSDGNPLFVEEMTRMLLESGWLREQEDSYELAGPLPDITVPTRLQDLLMARIDRMEPEAKKLMQLAATVGREFSFELLLEVLPGEERTLSRGLELLMSAGLVYAGANGFTIKHALIQDAAYESLSKRMRQQYHEGIARALEGGFAAMQPELIAQHWTRAGQSARAIPCWLQAGDAAARHYASSEASADYREALELASALPASDDAARLQIEAILKLASVSAKREQFEHDLENLEHARRLAERSDSREQLCRVLYWIGRVNYVMGRFDRGVELAEQSLEVADALGNDDALTAEPVNLLARIHCLRGEPAKASQYAARSVGQMHRLGNRTEEAAVSGVLAFAYGAHGRYREAIEAADHGVEMAIGLDHLPTLAACHMFRAVVNGWFGILQSSMSDFEQSLAIAERAGDIFRRYLDHGWRGEAYLLADELVSAQDALSQCIALGNQIGTTFHRGAFLAFLAKVKLCNGDLEGAQSDCEEATRISVETSQPWSRSIALRVYAETLLAANPQQAGPAEQAARMAIDIQAQRECRCDLAWSQLTLGQVLRAKGDFAAAMAVLVAAREGFADMGIARGIEKVSLVLSALGQSPRRPATSEVHAK